ncbi:unnamed protein product, partial [Rotaria sp. Silwood2]
INGVIRIFVSSLIFILVANQSLILRDNEYSHIVKMCGSTKDKPKIKYLKKFVHGEKTRELADDDNNDSTRLKITSNLGAITERLDDLIRNYISTNDKLDRTKMDKNTCEKMIHFKSLKSCIDPGESVGILAA